MTGDMLDKRRTLQQDNLELRTQLQAFAAEAVKNEAILKRSQERELELLQVESLPALLRLLVHGLSQSYSLDAVSIVLRDPQHDIRHLLLGSGELLENFPGVMLVDSLLGLVPFASSQRPWLGPYTHATHQALFPHTKTLRSVALIPMLRQQRLVGAINFGSNDDMRFTAQHGADFLAHLGVIAAVCLENTVNRARLLTSGMTDFLTGWHNRRYLNNRIKEELARAQRRNTDVACLMIDVDLFKEVNDSFGHLAGDTVLRELAHRIDGHIRASDTAARFGGDEFALLLPDTGVATAAPLAERIRQMVCADPIDLGEGRSHRLSLSIGVASLRPKREDRDLKALAERLMSDADAALYRAKGEGRGRVEAAFS